MALTESRMLPLGTLAPDFSLPDTVSGRVLSKMDVFGPKGTLLFFSCNHCPYVLYLNSAIVALANEYMAKGIEFVAISSNDVEKYPDDAPNLMTETAKREGYAFPYLYDESQEVARSYDAACTPDFYLFDENQMLVYRGRFDGARPKNELPITGEDLRNAMDNLLDGKPQATAQYPSAGCNIKWKEAK